MVPSHVPSHALRGLDSEVAQLAASELGNSHLCCNTTPFTGRRNGH